MKKGYMKSRVLSEICKDTAVSGGMLGSMLGVSRAAVWKAVNSLRAEGYFISGTGGGYVLSPENTRLCGEQLKASVKGADIVFKEETRSTNNDIKTIAEAGGKEFCAVVARRQTGGKGRLGREFYSPEGGLYFSLLLRPKAGAEDCLKITTAAAAAMRGAIETVSGREAKIKWVNDIFIGDKKVCGILTEGAFDAENGKLNYVVLGVGVNVAAPASGFPEDIRDTACSLFGSGKVPSLVYCALLERFLAAFKEYYKNIDKAPHIEEYRRHSYLDGKKITYKKDGNFRAAEVIGIGENAELIVNDAGKKVSLTSGEVEIKI